MRPGFCVVCNGKSTVRLNGKDYCLPHYDKALIKSLKAYKEAVDEAFGDILR